MVYLIVLQLRRHRQLVKCICQQKTPIQHLVELYGKINPYIIIFYVDDPLILNYFQNLCQPQLTLNVHGVGLTLVHRLRRWPNVKSTQFQRVAFVGSYRTGNDKHSVMFTTVWHIKWYYHQQETCPR